VCDVPRDLRQATDTLGKAIEQFDRHVTRASSRRWMRRRLSRRTEALPSRHGHRPTRHPVALPITYRRHPAPTVLDRTRALEARRVGRTKRLLDAVRRAGKTAADTVRRALGAVRRALMAIGGRGRGSR
jgi:hypothetical protein